ncbi:hypothetical protein NMY22_g17748 [Coprinellus aureogranulatus]|nr:hypothetical protein NMY22_g17748 [Coprinellus aureogranulatus]
MTTPRRFRLHPRNPLPERNSQPRLRSSRGNPQSLFREPRKEGASEGVLLGVLVLLSSRPASRDLTLLLRHWVAWTKGEGARSMLAGILCIRSGGILNGRQVYREIQVPPSFVEEQELGAEEHSGSGPKSCTRSSVFMSAFNYISISSGPQAGTTELLVSMLT